MMKQGRCRNSVKEENTAASPVKWTDGSKKRSEPNRVNNITSDEEMAERQKTAEQLAMVYGKMLPILQKSFETIHDPRKQGKIKHSLVSLLTYGILAFGFQIGSRREANKKMGQPTAWANMATMYPGLGDMPHADTLARLLERIDVDAISYAHRKMIKKLIRDKKFNRYMIDGKFLVAIDGSQKFCRDYRWQDEALVRHVGADKEEQAYAYVLEATLILSNGAAFPVYSEILSNEDWGKGESKQDCETRAFKRMVPILREMFGNKLTLLADCLYSCGPVLSCCHKYGWGYMTTLKRGGMSAFWEDAEGQIKAEPENVVKAVWRGREQEIRWTNCVEYTYGKNHKREFLNVVKCYETWRNEGVRTKKPKEMSSEYAWISSTKITAQNAPTLCNLIGRARWRIENGFHVEKHDGYMFEHCYSYDWNAMKGYHYLMSIARCMNVLVANSEMLAESVLAQGPKGFFRNAWLAISGMPLDTAQLQIAIMRKIYWKLNLNDIWRNSEAA